MNTDMEKDLTGILNVDDDIGQRMWFDIDERQVLQGWELLKGTYERKFNKALRSVLIWAIIEIVLLYHQKTWIGLALAGCLSIIRLLGLNSKYMALLHGTGRSSLFKIAMTWFYPFWWLKTKINPSSSNVILYQFLDSYIEKVKAKYKGQWEELDMKLLPPRTDQTIGDYWKTKGLSNKKTLAVRFSTLDPDKERDSLTRAVRMSQLLRFEQVTKYSDRWACSDLGDNMHVLSLFKRTVGVKKTHNEYMMQKFRDHVMTKYGDLKYRKKLNLNNLMHKALSSKGSAGQIAKGSMEEELWKTSTAAYTYKKWESLIRTTLELLMWSEKLPEELTQWMLYRKDEVLPGTKEGLLKITRTMNAANLWTRVVDAVTHGNYCEAIQDLRYTDTVKIGIDIITDVCIIQPDSDDFVNIACDYTDYDGTQHPLLHIYLMEAMVHSMKLNQEKPEVINYVIKKADDKNNRKVSSTSGIEITMTGQQATGDILTSYNNGEIAATAIDITAQELGAKFNESLDRNTIDTDTHGDDTNTNVNKNYHNPNEVLKAFIKNVNDLGMVIKEDDTTMLPMIHNGTCFWLSHAPIRRKFVSNDKKLQLICSLTSREREKCFAKWDWCAEERGCISAKTRSHMASKMLSYWMNSLGMPEIVVLSMLMSVVCAAAISESFDLPFSWMKIKPPNVLNLSLNKLIEHNTNMIYDDIEWQFIAISSSELENITKAVSQFNDLMLNKNENTGTEVTPIKLNVDEDKNLDYKDLLKQIVGIMKELTKKSQIYIEPNLIPWWEETTLPDNEESNVKIERPLILCDHSKTSNIICRTKNFREYAFILCRECWNTTSKTTKWHRYIMIDDYQFEEHGNNWFEWPRKEYSEGEKFKANWHLEGIEEELRSYTTDAMRDHWLSKNGFENSTSEEVQKKQHWSNKLRNQCSIS